MSQEGDRGGVEREPTPSVRGNVPDHRLELRASQIEFGFELDDERREAIIECLRRGDLRMVMRNATIDVLSGSIRGGDGYLWD